MKMPEHADENRMKLTDISITETDCDKQETKTIHLCELQEGSKDSIFELLKLPEFGRHRN